MQPQASQLPNGIHVASGYGLKIYVNRGHLVVHQGVGIDRETHRFNRATSGLRRLVVIGRTGFVTLEALRWIRDVGAALVHVGRDGELITTSAAASRDLASLRRSQALAATNAVGLEVARDLIGAKVAGQMALIDELPDGGGSASEVDHALGEIHRAQTLEVLLAAEAQAANAYWGAWSKLPIPIPGRQAVRLPEHWLTFGQRHSLLTGSPRLGINPAAAILNYLYALLEAETILACYAVGLDPGVGIFHADRRDRASLALDAMEAVRPAVDAYLLALLTQRTLSARDFVETPRGSCRLVPRLTAELAHTCTAWRDQAAPVVENIAHALSDDSPRAVPTATPLTGRNRVAAWDRRAPARERRPPGTTLTLPASCRDCGTGLSDRRRRYCDECRARRFREQGADGRRAAAGVLEKLRSAQRDPAHGGRAAEVRGSKNAAHQRAVRAWRGEQGDPAVFRREILPGLRDLRIAELVAATGLSEHYCSLIRLGKRVPHPRHWEALAAIGSSRSVGSSSDFGLVSRRGTRRSH